MIAKYAEMPVRNLVTRPDSAFNSDKRAKILADVQKNGIRNPVSVVYDGEYKVTRGHSRCWAAQVLNLIVPCVIFEKEPQGVGEIVEDIAELYDSPIKVKPSGAVLIRENYW